ncbi:MULTISPECIES: ABC transporter ATP-binding protein [Bacillus]|uniref:ABC transporter ATP-binding protein n=1 Tax=Bacillus TaxID=1386 RepID=UPI00061A272B|nr:ABC transporter ATP-binding protein [Bacillus altitudinis]MCA0926155.1 ABC transporter ATP-binding protein [Bacillus stratosphericus]MDH8711698.1 ABC-type multidrug transport system ATPase subunit [Micromonospora sp. 1209]BAT47520.1 ABC transporter [Bacillus pumilus]AKC64843.1 ABC transporter ATPase [Bacillus altitudinis]AKU31205.1 ABC transporter ATPase [Bacillus altitudinis]
MLSIHDLTKEYKESNFKVVIPEMHFKEGSIIGLLGKNGAGKTTILEMIAGLINPDKGLILINDSKQNFSSIGYMEDDPILFENLTCFELIKYQSMLIEQPLEIHQINSLLREYGLEEQAHRRSSALSRGMRQRISFILTILHNPNIILLDEPFTGLDPTNMADMKKHLRDFRDDNKIILLSTHIIQFAADLCDEILFIDNGSIVHSEKKSSGVTFHEDQIEKKFFEILS